MKANIISFSAIRFGQTQEEILQTLEQKFHEVRDLSPDLICFAEELLMACHDGNPNSRQNNTLALALAQKYAKELRTNVAINLEEFPEEYPGHSYNTAYIIGRAGEILGKYRKRHITYRAFAKGGLAGERYAVVDTDIGRIGMLICFDACWREDWQAMEDMGADLVWWPSAYHGSNLINAYAAVHMYNIVTAPWRHEARIIDRFGNTVAESSHWDAFVSAQLDLQTEMFHIDHHLSKISEMRDQLGARISLKVDGRGDLFELGINDPNLTMDEVKARFGLQSYRDYRAAAEADNARCRAQYPEPS